MATRDQRLPRSLDSSYAGYDQFGDDEFPYDSPTVGDPPYTFGIPAVERTKVSGDGTGEGLVVKGFAFCQHFRVPLEIAGGTIYASSSRGWKANGKPKVDAGVYLDMGWMYDLGIVGNRIRTAVGHPAILMRWPDMGVPNESWLALATSWARDYLEEGKGVEVSCVGGHGRTGTFIACILREYGFTPEGAINVVRKRICDKCIETTKQEEFIASWPRKGVRT